MNYLANYCGCTLNTTYVCNYCATNKSFANGAIYNIKNNSLFYEYQRSMVEFTKVEGFSLTVNRFYWTSSGKLL